MYVCQFVMYVIKVGSTENKRRFTDIIFSDCVSSRAHSDCVTVRQDLKMTCLACRVDKSMAPSGTKFTNAKLNVKHCFTHKTMIETLS